MNPGRTTTLEPRHEPLKKLLAYWLEKKGDRRAPGRVDIDPLEIVRLLPHVIMIDVERSPPRFRYRLVGTEIVKQLGRDLTGRYLDQLEHNPRIDAIAAEYARVASWGAPICATWEYTRDDGRFIRYERLALPLSSDGKTVDVLFGGTVFDKAHGGVTASR